MAYGPKDSFAQLNRLLDAPHTAAGSVRKTCLAVEECLATNRDNLRGFFEKSFPNLLKRVFGYGDFEASWLNIVTKGRDADARALVDLLAPDGKLFAAMAQADNDRLVQYIFPTERLPAHTQELLKEPGGLGRRLLDTWPQYRGRIRTDVTGRPQVFLNVLEYFMFWTAFYVLRGSTSDGSRVDSRPPGGGSSSAGMMGSYVYGQLSGSYGGAIRSVGNAIVGGLIMGRPAGGLQSHPYYRLLRTYLEYFLPRSSGGAGGAADSAAVAGRGGPVGGAGMTPGVGGAGGGATGGAGYGGLGGGGYGYGGMGLGMGITDGGAGGGGAVSGGGRATYKPTLTAAAGGPDSRGSVVLSILVEFWLTDLAEPLPAAAPDGGAGGAAAGGQPGAVAAAAAAAAGLLGGGGGVGLGLGGGASPGGLAAGGLGGAAGGLGGAASPTPVTTTTPTSVRMLTYQPPSEELVEGLVALVRYVFCVEQAADGGAAAAAASRVPAAGSGGMLASGGGAAAAMGLTTPRQNGGGAAAGLVMGSAGRSLGGAAARTPPAPAQVGRAPWLPETPVKTPPPPPPRLLVPPAALAVGGASASPAVQAVSRKVYRMLRRAFSQWPASSPSSLTPLISLWLSVIAPWCPTAAHTRRAAVAAAAASATDNGGAGGPGGAAAASGLGGGGAAGGGGGNGGGGGPQPPHHHHHGILDAGALGSAAAAAAGVVEATAAKLHHLRDRDVAGATSRELLSQYKYTPAWRSHVLAHLPFYTVLLPQFVSLTLSRLKYRPDSALRDLDRVLAVLGAAGPDLLRLLRSAELAFNDFALPLVRPAGGAGAGAGGAGASGAGGPGAPHGGHNYHHGRRGEGEFADLVPWWFEQAQDFEAAAAAGSPPNGGVQPDVAGRLFALDAAGAAYTACLLLRSAETLGRPELVAALRQSAAAVLPLEAILPAAVADTPRAGDGGAGMDASRFPRPGRWSLGPRDDPHALWLACYKGDPLLRPIASNEIGLLVRPLVRLSARLNGALGLDVPYTPGEEAEDPPEHLGQQVLLWARRRGLRVNLRFLAEVQTLAWLLVLLLLVWSAGRIFGGSGGGAAAGGAAAVGGAAAGGGGYGHGHGGHAAYGGRGNAGVQYNYQHHQQYHNQYRQQQYQQYQYRQQQQQQHAPHDAQQHVDPYQHHQQYHQQQQQADAAAAAAAGGGVPAGGEGGYHFDAR
ncbi:hypothetical protein HYH02_008643 [Chlamydomonas schloesseri]|uniref:Sphingomyelin phosphodiesterase 4 n=1 Tax=Chlamydomonas schloesseri TaxID=2026947 RepID=A0A836B1S8_9CHLO|nr:hypothetical protein HYH02_008643 [Chlamydomonas schloesseri]|eukprot:KAG2445175.1 hypothetical protein HYH02_008643 [Chlamydomonas schloesseri]